MMNFPLHGIFSAQKIFELLIFICEMTTGIRSVKSPLRFVLGSWMSEAEPSHLPLLG